MHLPSRPAFSLSRERRQRGFTLVEIVVATGVTAILAASLIAALLTTQKLAASARVMTNARVVVQRNIDTALGIKFTSASEPEILKITEPEGVPFGDYKDNEEALRDDDAPQPIHISKSGNTVVQGQLTRIVRAYPTNVSGLVVREVTFRIDYEFNGRDYTHSMTTLRARDDQ